ncbi:MAG: hypothetical protein QF890_16690 [Myxococcota bacterium]|jgi:hypothetical protein|nr:hypothetical protein [bacterium]MDP6075273.1 hypothetical protein [Myxococcota bacterium]MDP7298600.1 hypothetical protein [Myxococcota bacterium]MDP7434196.1 hypothetical protein [Myxococcota bacterium]HJO24553.1 hypothetical protein [Myxococcota bacterium]
MTTLTKDQYDQVLRDQFRETLAEARRADEATKIDFWRRVAIYQNGFAGPNPLNQRFRHDKERATIKIEAFMRAEAENLEQGERGHALGFSIMAMFTAVCSDLNELLISEFRKEIELLGVELGFPNISLGSRTATSINSKWMRPEEGEPRTHQDQPAHYSTRRAGSVL